MNINKFLGIIIFSSLLCVILCYANGITNLSLDILLCSISFFFSLLLFFSRESLESFNKDSKERKEMVSLLSQIIYYKTKNAPLSKTLLTIFDTMKGDDLKPKLNNAIKRMQLGSNFSDAMHSSFSGLLKSMDLSFFEAADGPYSQISNSVSIYLDRLREKSAVSLDSLQRSSTIGMFLSTLLPSFVLFAFVGATIISQSAISLLPLSFALLIGIPLVYALNNASFMRRLIAETV